MDDTSAPTAEIEWSTPPPSQQGRSPNGSWSQRLAPLRDRPGEWACLGSHNPGIASQLKSGRLGGAAPGEFEATSRTNGTSRPTLYVRYVGTGDAGASSANEEAVGQ